MVEVGEGVDDYRPGDRVISLFQPRRFGGPIPATANSESYAVATTGLEPVIDRIFEFDDATAAFNRLAKGTHLGKLVIRVG